MVAEHVDNEPVGAGLEQLYDGVVERVLVLLQPAGHIVGHGASIVHYREKEMQCAAKL